MRAPFFTRKEWCSFKVTKLEVWKDQSFNQEKEKDAEVPTGGTMGSWAPPCDANW